MDEASTLNSKEVASGPACRSRGSRLIAPVTIVVLLPPAVLLQRSLTYVQMRTAARTDAKTGLLNAAAWHQEAEREIVRLPETAGRWRC